MDDAFDEFLRTSLAPAERPADRPFMLRVQARIAFEEKWQDERRTALAQLAWQVSAVAILAAGFLLISRAPTIVDFVATAPAVALAIALSVVGLLVLTLTARTSAMRPGAALRLH